MSSSPDVDAFERKVLSGWEEIYKRGLLTMWLLLAVRDEPRYAAEIAAFVADRTFGTMSADDRSLYRALRRLAHAELVVATDRRGSATGIDRKYYALTPTGERVLEAFLERNIRPIYLEGNADLFGPAKQAVTRTRLRSRR
jgi:DNA-binding PadR family transcriptional regulator